MIRSHSNNRFRIPHRVETGLATNAPPPRDLLLDMVEEGYDVPETALDVDVAVGGGDEQDFEFGGEGGAGEEYG